MIMRMLALKDMMANYYKVQPADMAVMDLIGHLPWTGKIFYGLIIDVRLVKKRKYYLIFFGVIITITQFLISAGQNVICDPWTITYLNVAYAVGAAFLDACIDSIIIVLARQDPQYGQQNLVAFSMTFFGFGAMFGALLSAYLTEYCTPFTCYKFGGLVGILLTIGGCFLDDDFETNKWAT